jgi:hypothetical protein
VFRKHNYQVFILWFFPYLCFSSETGLSISWNMHVFKREFCSTILCKLQEGITEIKILPPSVRSVFGFTDCWIRLFILHQQRLWSGYEHRCNTNLFCVTEVAFNSKEFSLLARKQWCLCQQYKTEGFVA